MKITKKIFGISLIPIILLIIGSVISGVYVNSSNLSTQNYINGYGEKQALLSQIYKNLGYGGGIHAFKNYILRAKEEDRVEAKMAFLKTERLTQQYLDYNDLSSIEQKSLQVVLKTVLQYQAQLDIAEKLIQNKKTIKEVDAVVKVDDIPAESLLVELESFFQKKKIEELEKLKNSHEKALNTLLIVFSFSLLISLFMSHAVSKQILGSIKKLMNMSGSIEKEKYDFSKDEVSSFPEDELKTLAERMISMAKKLNLTLKKLKVSNNELSNFAHVTSHDLQEPIKKSSAFVELLALETKGTISDTGKQYMHEIVNLSERMVIMIRTLLDFSKYTTKKIQLNPINLNSIIATTLKDYKSQIDGKKLVIKVAKFPPILGHEETLQIVFNNLISNAVKYSSDGEGEIEITYELSEGIKNNYLSVMVRDSGIGFNMKYIDTIFRPFGRLHSETEYSGLGIGLPLCKRIIEAHDAQLMVSSVEGIGSTFSFKLILV